MTRAGRLVPLTLVVLALAGACFNPPSVRSSPASHRPRPARSTSTRSTATHPRPRPRPRPPLVGNPLTGQRPSPAGPVVAVKIDDTAAARPQYGINAADVVYVEAVEAGLTRLLAVYAGSIPATVGSVRSVRLADLELLAQYGHVALAYSGGAAGVVSALHGSSVRDASALADPGAYFRSGAKPMPYNLMLDLPALRPAVSGSAGVRDIGMRWSASLRGLAAKPAATSVTTTVGQTPVGFRWDGQTYERVIDGAVAHQADGAPVATRNVIIQSCLQAKDGRDVDVDGNPSTYTRTVGHGRAIVLRDGKVIDGTWSRPNPRSGTRYLDSHGRDITLHPGGAWVVLVARGTAVDMH